uniref:CTLH domain-containing protein n=1 Tax=Panagrolaimus superbus TaxID=310955 RepID=A0A914Z8G7_9BILA
MKHLTDFKLKKLKETGVINGEFSDDILFLRQLILDGQWDNAIDFVDPLTEIPEFDLRSFKYLVTKYKYFELLCIKQEPGPMHDNDFAVEEIVECLKDLEQISPTPEDYRQLCALLTLPKLSDHVDFRNWNPSNARVECFHKILPLVSSLLSNISSSAKADPIPSSINERLLQLITKGIFYEACIDFCQAQALGNNKAAENGPQLTQPKLEAPWGEHILITPMKPGGQFPHSLVPTSRLKCAQKMTQSLILPSTASAFSMEASIIGKARKERAAHPMSHSMAPDVGFSIPSLPAAESAMQQSQIITNMFESSELTKTSRPLNNSLSLPLPLGTSSSTTESRRELDAITRKNQISRGSALPPVPELSTPTADIPIENAMTQSRLFQEFSNRQRIVSLPQTSNSMQAPPSMAMPQIPPPHSGRLSYDPLIPSQMPPQMQILSDPYQMQLPYGPPPPQQQQRPVSTIIPAIPSNPYDSISRPQSMIGGNNGYNHHHPYPPPPSQQPPSSMNSMGPSSSSNSLPVHFVPLCRYEDSQAIRAVSFHPSGRYFAVGTNSKQMIICRYPDVRKAALNNRSLPFGPEICLNRPKQHRGSVYCCGFSPSGELLATGSNDKTLRLMSFNAEECKIGAEVELTMHDGTVRDLIFLDDLNHPPVLVSGGAGNCKIFLTDTSTGQTFKELTGHTAPILGLYGWGGCTFSSCSQDKSIRFWDLRAANAVNVIQPNARTSNAPVTSVCVDPSGKLLVSGHEDASIMLYDITGGRVIQTFRPHGDEVRTVRFSNAAYYLLSGSYDRRIVITDMRGDLTNPLMYLPVAEHNDKIIQCRWHPQDFTFLSTSADRTVVLWSLPQV